MGFFSRNNTTDGSSDPVDITKVYKSVKLVKDPNGLPANSATKIESGGGSVSLVKSAKLSAISLEKQGLSGIRADAVVLLDHSGSMSYDYQNGKVQELVEKALAFGLQFDNEIEVIPFDTVVRREAKVDLSNYAGIVNAKLYDRFKMGSTDLTSALIEVRKRAAKATQPIFLIVVTDGSPDNARTCTEVVCELAGYPVFIKFLAIRDVPYLQNLDDLGTDKRLLDNVDTKFFSDLTSVSDKAFADAMADEWASWIKAATDAGVLTA